MSRLTDSPRVQLTARDLAVLGSLAEYRYLTVSQLQRLHFASEQTARRRLRLLAAAKLLRLFQVATVAERVAALGSAGAEALSVDGRAIEAPPSRPQNLLFLQHHLAAAEFRIRLTQSCAARSDLRLARFLPEYAARPSRSGQPMKVLRDEVPPLGGEPVLTHCPDGAFAMERAGQHALFFLELDRGTEVLGRPEHGVGKAVRFYLRYLTSGKYQRYRQEFGVGEDFRGFRALFVTTSQQRLEHIRQRCGSIPFEPTAAKRFIWLATETVLKETEPLRHPWCSLDPSDSAQYLLAPHP